MEKENKSSRLYDSSDRKTKVICALAGIVYATVVVCFAYTAINTASRFLSRLGTPSQIERAVEGFGGIK